MFFYKPPGTIVWWIVKYKSNTIGEIAGFFPVFMFQKRFNNWGLIVGILAFLILSADSIIFCADSGDMKFYYFNPDATQGNLGRLKAEMDRFLSDAGYPIAFQPFSHLTDFHHHVTNSRPSFVFAPRWYQQQFGKALNLRPFLMPLRNGAETYRKALLVHRNSGITVDQLSQKSLSMTSLGPKVNQLLHQMLSTGRTGLISNLSPVIVPKDTDAIFALILKQVDMAMVTREAIDALAKLNPTMLQDIRILTETKPIPMPVLCYIEGVATPDDVQNLQKILLHSGSEQGYRSIMEIFQADAWKKVSN